MGTTYAELHKSNLVPVIYREGRQNDFFFFFSDAEEIVVVLTQIL